MAIDLDRLQRDMPHTGVSSSTALALITRCRAARNAALEEAAKVAVGFQHVNTPRDGGDDLDRIARYSNDTCAGIAAAIRKLKDGDA